MNINLILEKVDFLHGIIDPNWVDGNPGQPGPIFETGIADYIVAELLRDIGLNLEDREMSARLHGIGKELVSGASHQLIQSWEEGSDICPPWPVPHRGMELTSTTELQPFLQNLTPAMNDILLAQALRQLASLTTNEKASNAIRQVGELIVKTACEQLFDEYCETPVKHRIPQPRKKTAAA